MPREEGRTLRVVHGSEHEHCEDRLSSWQSIIQCPLLRPKFQVLMFHYSQVLDISASRDVGTKIDRRSIFGIRIVV